MKMGRRGKGKAKGKPLTSVNEKELTERSRQLVQSHVTQFLIRHQLLELHAEKPSTSRANRKPNFGSTFYSQLKDAFADAFYSNNILKIPKLQSIYKAEDLEATAEPIPKNGNNSKTDIEDMLIILKVCQLRGIIVKIEEEQKIGLAGYVISPHARAKLSKLDYVQEGIRRDIRTMREQLRSIRKTDIEQLNSSEKNSDCFAIVDEHGENISDEGRIVQVKDLSKTHEQIKKEFRSAFYANMAAHLEGIYSWQNMGAKMVKCSSEHHVTEDHSEVLARAIKVIESRILDYDSGKTVYLEDEEQNYYKELDGLYPDIPIRGDYIADMEENFFLNPPTSLGEPSIIINTDGEEMCKQEFKKFFTNECHHRPC
ncbi:uncharacterized protein [Bactrocera oleae]|uniref:uncharacterized protein isoform X2 n=1 Tax=Bactrocera oleae TaxID=104688 RepID=UPI00387E2BAB